MSEAAETRFPDRLITVCFLAVPWNTQLLSSVPSKENNSSQSKIEFAGRRFNAEKLQIKSPVCNLQLIS